MACFLFGHSAVAAPRDAAATKKADEVMTTHAATGDFTTAESVLLGVDVACADRCSNSVRARTWALIGIVRSRAGRPVPEVHDAFRRALTLDCTLEPDPRFADAAALDHFRVVRAESQEWTSSQAPAAPDSATEQAPIPASSDEDVEPGEPGGSTLGVPAPTDSVPFPGPASPFLESRGPSCRVAVAGTIAIGAGPPCLPAGCAGLACCRVTHSEFVETASGPTTLLNGTCEPLEEKEVDVPNAATVGGSGEDGAVPSGAEDIQARPREVCSVAGYGRVQATLGHSGSIAPTPLAAGLGVGQVYTFGVYSFGVVLEAAGPIGPHFDSQDNGTLASSLGLIPAKIALGHWGRNATPYLVTAGAGGVVLSDGGDFLFATEAGVGVDLSSRAHPLNGVFLDLRYRHQFLVRIESETDDGVTRPSANANDANLSLQVGLFFGKPARGTESYSEAPCVPSGSACVAGRLCCEGREVTHVHVTEEVTCMCISYPEPSPYP